MYAIQPSEISGTLFAVCAIMLQIILCFFVGKMYSLDISSGLLLCNRVANKYFQKGTVYAIYEGFPLGEYLLIENRGAMKWSSDMPHRGILIYHVDENADGMKRRGFPGKPGWPADHYSIALQVCRYVAWALLPFDMSGLIRVYV